MLSTPLSHARRPEIPALTSLRFFAAFWVVLFHVRAIHFWTGGPRPYIALISLGYLGVNFFFVLSGFILVYVYGGRRIQKRRFWQARFARVYPAYFFSLIVCLPLVGLALPQMRHLHLTALTFTAYPLLLEAWFPSIFFFWNTVAWSLSAEFFFYLVFPFAMRLLERLDTTGLRLWMSGSFLTSLAITSSYVLLHPDGVAHTTSDDNNLFWLAVLKINPLARLPEFLLGMGLGTAFIRRPVRPQSWPIVLAAALMVPAIFFRDAIPYPIMHTGLLAPVFALFIFGFATQPAWTRFLSSRPLVLLGEASYSLYLLHVMAIIWLAYMLHLAGSPHIHAIVGAFLVGTTLAAILVFLYIETPLRRLLRPRTRIRPLAEAPTPAAEPTLPPIPATEP